jgi:hypothetical protein
MAAEQSVTVQYFTGDDDVSIGVKNSQWDIKQTITMFQGGRSIL